jgi:hypothetical protein
LCEDIFALVHGTKAFPKATAQSPIQIVTLQKNATNAMNKEFQRTYFNFYCPLMKIGLFEMTSGAEQRPVVELGSPVFDRITIHLDDDYYKGKAFVIEVKNNKSENRYIRAATLNGRKLARHWLYHDEITGGGTLTLEMGDTPDETVFESGQP